MSAETFVGTHVATQLDVVVRPSGRWSATNEEAGIPLLVSRGRAFHPMLIVAEATGGFEHAAIAALAEGIPVVVANPRQIRDFARTTGQLVLASRCGKHCGKVRSNPKQRWRLAPRTG